MEKIIKDGKIVGLRKKFEVGDKYPEQFGEFVYLDKEPTQKDYETLTKTVLQQTFEYIKNSAKVWDCDGFEFIFKRKEEFENNSPLFPKFPADKIGTLGAKLTISRIIEEGENL